MSLFNSFTFLAHNRDPDGCCIFDDDIELELTFALSGLFDNLRGNELFNTFNQVMGYLNNSVILSIYALIQIMDNDLPYRGAHFRNACMNAANLLVPRLLARREAWPHEDDRDEAVERLNALLVRLQRTIHAHAPRA